MTEGVRQAEEFVSIGYYNQLAASLSSERSARIRAEARVAELLGALKPFADHPNGNGVVGDNEFRDPWLTFGDFRRARSITTGER